MRGPARILAAAVAAVLCGAAAWLLHSMRPPPATSPETASIPAVASQPVAATPQTASQIVANPAAPVMPTDSRSIEALLVGLSAAEKRAMAEEDEQSPPVRAAAALRNVLAEQGYDPQRTLLYWMSDEFRVDAWERLGGASVSEVRAVENLLHIAFADGVDRESFESVIAKDLDEVRAAARERRLAFQP